MKKAILLVLLSLWFSSSVFAAHLHKEKEYQAAWCAAAGGVMEYRLDDGARVDCLTDEYVIEFDFAPKWAEAIGQALYYAEKTGKKPGIVLIIEGKKGPRFIKRLNVVALKYHINVWIMTPGNINQSGAFFRGVTFSNLF